MKKIMFNDKYGLTQAVLDGRKTIIENILTAMKREDFISRINEMPLKELADKIDKCDSITASLVMLKKYILRKIDYVETLVANGTSDDIDFEELVVSLIEDLRRCFVILVLLGDLSANNRIPLERAIKYVKL